MDNKLIGKRIQLTREEHELSQEQLAEKAGIGKVFISAIERGVKSPSLESFVSIANALNTSADILLMDVLDTGYKVKASRLSELLESISPKERERIFSVVETMVRVEKSMQDSL